MYDLDQAKLGAILILLDVMDEDHPAFYQYSPVYLATNENFRGYIPSDYQLVNDRVLSVTSSGDIPIEFVRSGAKVIDCFDINNFAKYITELKKAAILGLNCEEFHLFFDGYIEDNLDLINDQVFDELVYSQKIAPLLAGDYRLFWDFVYTKANELTEDNVGLYLYKSPLFIYGSGAIYSKLKNMDSFANPKNYYQTRKLLKKSQFNYIDTHILDLPNALSTDNYACIYLSNIADYLSPNDYHFSPQNNYNEFINNEMIKHLATGGRMITNYLFYYQGMGRTLGQDHIMELKDLCGVSSFDSVSPFGDSQDGALIYDNHLRVRQR